MSDNELDIEYEEYNDQLDPDIYLDNEEFNEGKGNMSHYMK